jgi:lipoprotein-anchoring transpeptidase ErfK/SrfK
MSSTAPTTVSAATGGPSTAASKPSTSAGPTTTTTTSTTTSTTKAPNQSVGTVALPSISSVTPKSGSKVGVAMPVRVNFASSVSSANRAAIEKSMKVTTTPHVDGAWSWLDSNTVDFRPQGFWPAGTKVTVQFGSTDRKLDFSIGDDHEIVVNAATHMLNVYENGALVKALPSGTGKSGWETYSGTIAVEDMVPHIEMTSCAIGIQCTKGGPGWYDLQTYHDLQLTDSGTFIHSAWWDDSLGKANVSHGCIHLSEANAALLWNIVQVGDPVTVKGTSKKVSQSNGYADYTLSWSQWLSNSAAGIQVF